MKKIHILGVALFAMFAFGVVSAGSAFAVETAQWLVDAATIALTEKVNVDLTTNSAGILLEDMNATLKPDVLCLTVAKALGFLYSNGEDEVVEGECTEVESMTSGVTCSSVKPVNLPWLTQLVQESSGAFLDLIKSDGKGIPGWEVECTALGVKVTDKCETENGKPEQLNNTSTEEVEATFLESVAESEEAKCSVGGEKEGLVVGTLLTDALSASGTELLALTVSLATEVS